MHRHVAAGPGGPEGPWQTSPGQTVAVGRGQPLEDIKQRTGALRLSFLHRALAKTMGSLPAPSPTAVPTMYGNFVLCLLGLKTLQMASTLSLTPCRIRPLLFWLLLQNVSRI